MSAPKAAQQTHKQIHGGASALLRMAAGVELLARLNRVGYGAAGAHVVMERKMDSPIALSSGADACKGLDVSDPVANLGVRLVMQAQERVRASHGAGGATVAILLDEMLRAALPLIAAGMDANALRRGMKRQVEHVCTALARHEVVVEPSLAVRSLLGRTAADDLNALVSQALEHSGIDGMVRIRQSQRADSRLQVHDGIYIDQGLVSGALAMDPQRGASRIVAPRIFVTRRDLNAAADVLGLLDRVRAAGETLLIVAPSINGEALSTLLANHFRQTVQVAAIQAPDHGEHRDASLLELAALTGAFLDEGGAPSCFSLDQLGRAGEVVIERGQTVIRGARALEPLVGSLVAQIEALLQAQALTEYERERLQARLGRLKQRFVTLEIGGTNDVVSGERLERAEALLKSTRVALAGRLIPGGGSALACVSASELPDLEHVQGMREGANLVRAALLAPARQVLRNAGIQGAAAESVIERYRHGSDSVFDVSARRWVPLASGPLDSLERLLGALRAAVSTLSMVLNVRTVITADLSAASP